MGGANDMKGLPLLIFPLSVICLVIMLATVHAAGTPKAIFETTSFSFGEVKEGAPLVHAFAVLNKGDAPLRIEKVSAG